MTNKTVLYIQDYPFTEGGGIEVMTNADAQLLVELGHAVTIASTRTTSETNCDSNVPKNKNKIKYIKIQSTNQLEKLIDHNDVVIINATFSLREGMMTALNCVNLLQRQHYIYLHTSPNHIPFSRLANLKIEEKDFLLNAFKNHLSSNLATTLCVSKSLQTDVLGFAPNANTEVVYNARDWDRFVVNEYADQIPHTDCTYIGEISGMKGVDVFIYAVHELKQKGRYISAKIIGNGQDELYMKTLATTLGLENEITWLPYTPNAEIPNYLSRTNVLVVPSYTETWGNIAMEAMALGTPVICADCEGLVELSGNGRNAILFKKGLASDLAGKIAGVLDQIPQYVLDMAVIKTTIREMHGKDARKKALHGLVQKTKASNHENKECMI